MSNQVTFKIDSRIFLGLVAFVAVLGIFGIGWWLGQQLNQETPQASSAAVVQQPGSVTGSVTGDQVPVQAPAPGQPTQMLSGRAPVSPEEVPVGEGEARLWIEEIADTNWNYDFGAVPADTASERDLVITNVGKAELVIKEATAACGCAAAIVADSSVSPGESTTVRVKYDPRTNREFGKYIKKQVRISSNDPIVPLVEFSITADVAAQ